MKNKALLPLLLILILILSACSQDKDREGDRDRDKDGDRDTTYNTETEAEMVLSLEELAQFNGKDGNPAYIAVNGIIYDVTDIGVWKNGDHNGFEAGKDLTDFFPHDQSRLDYATIVGTLKDDTTDDMKENKSETTDQTVVSDSNSQESESTTEASMSDTSDMDDKDNSEDTSENKEADNAQSSNTSDTEDSTLTPSTQTDTISTDTSIEDSTAQAQDTTEVDTPSNDSNLPIFTEDELRQYNGENGAPIYIAFEGFVYDVSFLSGWKDGMHNGIQAGYDLTDDIQYAPHGVEKLEKATIIGILE